MRIAKLLIGSQKIAVCALNRTENQALRRSARRLLRGRVQVRAAITAISRPMDATLYFELVDAVARIDKQSELVTIHQRVTTTPMHPLERRVLERALRARCEALALRSEFALPACHDLPSATKPIAARG